MNTYPIRLNLAQAHMLLEIATLEIGELKDLQRRAMAGEEGCWGAEQMAALREWTRLRKELTDLCFDRMGDELSPDRAIGRR
ncbi:hypothetical protein [Kroppenstedtia sanguinis]|uniref:Uncharacterized protein n=1 Tax=Kroppenstedtia sanguinis TaxID=1380684 RepID=A0ABW4C4G4_9BACL